MASDAASGESTPAEKSDRKPNQQTNQKQSNFNVLNINPLLTGRIFLFHIFNKIAFKYRVFKMGLQFIFLYYKEMYI
jgi:hypothetical protein